MYAPGNDYYIHSVAHDNLPKLFANAMKGYGDVTGKNMLSEGSPPFFQSLARRPPSEE